MGYQDFQPDQLILRDHLARERTVLANERTLLAYVRTAMMLLVSGVTVLKLIVPSTGSWLGGWMLIAAGAILTLYGLIRFLKLRRNLQGIAPSQS